MNDVNSLSSPANVDQTSTAIIPTEQTDLLNRVSTTMAKIANRNFTVDLLTILFGIASWIGINSTYLQLPLIVANAPEGWNLPSYLVVIIQMGNIGPIIYTALQKILPGRIKDAHFIYVILLIGSTAGLLTAFFYSKTAVVFGAERSVALFVMVFFLALVGCSSSVLFMPYMGRFKEIYLITYLIGEGLSGFIPSIVALIQGIGGNAECVPTNTTLTGEPEFTRHTPEPRFGTKTFFFFVFGMMVTSTIAFCLLDWLKLCKKAYAAGTIRNGNEYNYDYTVKNSESGQHIANSEERVILTPEKYNFLIILMGVVCVFGNGVFPSIQSYSCLPYGNVAYHLTVTLSSIANPVSCFMAIWLPHKSVRIISGLCAMAGVLSIYAMTTALMSPNPPLKGSVWGEITVVLTWIILIGLFSYIKLSITTEFRLRGGKSLVWVGAVSQMGSFFGAVGSFLIINYTQLFVSSEQC